MLTHALLLCYFFIVTPTPGIYTLSLHDALPISGREQPGVELRGERAGPVAVKSLPLASLAQRRVEMIEQRHRDVSWHRRSEEHTSELQSHSDLVCRLLLEKKKNKKDKQNTNKY